MFDVFALHLLPAVLNRAALALPNYSKFAGLANIRIQCQLPEFSGIFCEGDMP